MFFDEGGQINVIFYEGIMSVIPSENYAKLHLMMVIYPPEAKKKPGRKKKLVFAKLIISLRSIVALKKIIFASK